MAKYRLTHVAQADIVTILAWSEERFGKDARKRYEALIATAIRDAASRTGDVGHTTRPELGDGVFSWHLAHSRTRGSGKTVPRPRRAIDSGPTSCSKRIATSGRYRKILQQICYVTPECRSTFRVPSPVLRCE